MHKLLKKYFDDKEKIDRDNYEYKRNDQLMKLGLFETIYGKNKEQTPEFPYYDAEKNKFYNVEPIEISDSDYERLCEYEDIMTIKRNKVASVIEVFALLIFLFGLIASVTYGILCEPVYGVVCFLIVFFIGLLFLGISEIIYLLEEIKENTEKKKR